MVSLCRSDLRVHEQLLSPIPAVEKAQMHIVSVQLQCACTHTFGCKVRSHFHSPDGGQGRCYNFCSPPLAPSTDCLNWKQTEG